MARFGAILELVFLLSFLSVFDPSPLNAAEGRVLVFGRVHDDPVRSIRDRQEFVDYIAKKLATLGISGGRIMVV